MSLKPIIGLSLGAFPGPFFSYIFHPFSNSIQYYLSIIFCPLVMLPYPHVDNYLDYGTLLSPELEKLTLPERERERERVGRLYSVHGWWHYSAEA